MKNDSVKKVVQYFEDRADTYYKEGYLDETTERFYFETRKQIIHDMIEDFHGHILDIGAGPGVMSLPLMERPDTSLTVVEISMEMLKIIERQMQSQSDSFSQRIRLIHGDILEQHFESDSFDLIICAGILAHLSNLDLLFQKLVRWLKPGGQCIVQITNASHIAGFLQVHLANVRNLYDYTLNHTPHHKVNRLFRKYNLRVLKQRHYHLRFPGMRLFGRRLLRIIEKQVYRLCRHTWLRFLGQDIIYLVTKSGS
jgi:ubiquinone/menaquinone biosynthesis C-methylase UbiE